MNVELKLTEYQENLEKNWVAVVDYKKMGAKTTVALVTLKNGFEIVGTSACVNPANFNKEMGQHYALVDALKKLDELQGFQMQHADYLQATKDYYV